MIILTVIPYILGITLPKGFMMYPPLSTFNVRIDTLYINKSTEFDFKSNAGLSFDLKCRSELIKSIKCYIDQSSIDYSPSTDPMYEHTKKNNFTISSLNYSQIYFTIIFNVKGKIRYIFENKNVKNKWTLLEMYRMIGDQLNIGDDIKLRNSKFVKTEESVFGTCPTFYFVSRNRNFINKNYTLRSLIANENFKLKKNTTLEITKYRYLKNCYHLNNYILGKKLWTDLFSESDVTENMTRSETQMLLAKHNFYSMTENRFKLYDKENNTVGDVQERIEVSLTSTIL